MESRGALLFFPVAFQMKLPKAIFEAFWLHFQTCSPSVLWRNGLNEPFEVLLLTSHSGTSSAQLFVTRWKEDSNPYSPHDFPLFPQVLRGDGAGANAPPEAGQDALPLPPSESDAQLESKPLAARASPLPPISSPSSAQPHLPGTRAAPHEPSHPPGCPAVVPSQRPPARVPAVTPSRLEP